MAWEWVGPVATGVVGLAGIASTLYTAGKSRKITKEVAEQGNRATVEVAREQRAQEWKKTSYERILRVATETTSFVEFADVIWMRDAKPPDVDEVADELGVLLDLYASDDFETQFGAWSCTVSVCREILAELAEGSHLTDDANREIAERHYGAASSMNDALMELRDLARKELAQTPRRPAGGK